MSEIKLYKALRAKLGDVEAQELVSFIREEINAEIMDCKNVFLTKQDKADILAECKNIKFDILAECRQIFLTKDDKADILRESKNIKSEILAECRQIFLTKDDKVDIMRTIYIVGLVQFLTIIGALIGIVSFFLKHP